MFQELPLLLLLEAGCFPFLWLGLSSCGIVSFLTLSAALVVFIGGWPFFFFFGLSSLSCASLSLTFLCPRHSKNGGGALSVTPVRSCVRPSVRSSVRPLSKFGVRSITFERLHRFDSYLVCVYKTSKHRSSLIWVTTHWFLTELWAFYKNIAQKLVSAQ